MDVEHEDTEHLAQILARGSIWTLAGMDGWMQRRTDRWTMDKSVGGWGCKKILTSQSGKPS